MWLNLHYNRRALITCVGDLAHIALKGAFIPCSAAAKVVSSDSLLSRKLLKEAM